MAKPAAQLEKEDVLLLLLSALSGPAAKKEVASITRVEKLMFLLQKETDFSGRLQDRFEFKAWKFGPFSKDIYDAFELVASLGLVEVEERELANYMDYTEQDELITLEEAELIEPIVEKIFWLTDRGRRVAEKLRQSIPESDWAEIVALKKRFERLPLTGLIQYVYHKYPETTEKSVLEHLKPR